MKLCLINPPHSYLVNPDAQVALGLLYVAAAAEKAGHEVRVYNGAGKRLVQIDAELPAADAYGITATSLDYALDVEGIAANIRARWPGAPIILGGPVYLAPEQVNFRLITTLVVGDGEAAICDLLGLLARGKDLPPIHQGLSTDVAEAAPPLRKAWPGPLGGPIFASGESYYPGGSSVITTSRGCPHHCAFCANERINDRRVRMRPLEAVVGEMEQVVTDYGIRQFRFSDETINMGEHRLAELCASIRSSTILCDGVVWKASSRAKPNSVAMYRDMYAAGCRELSVGIESADQEVLDAIRKDATVEDGRTALGNIRKAGITARALLMAGLPGERPETLRLNLQFLLDEPFDLVSLTVFAPVPGCDIWQSPDKYRCDIIERDFKKLNFYYYSGEGGRDMKPFIRLWDWNYEEHAAHVRTMRDVASVLGRLNRG